MCSMWKHLHCHSDPGVASLSHRSRIENIGKPDYEDSLCCTSVQITVSSEEHSVDRLTAMKFQILFGILAIVLSVSGKRWNYRSRKSCSWSNRQIEILVPQGLRVVQPFSRSIATTYGIEAYINRVPARSGICDICVNASIVDPIIHPAAIIRAGDHFQYTLSYYYDSGSIRQYKCQFRVAGKKGFLT